MVLIRRVRSRVVLRQLDSETLYNGLLVGPHLCQLCPLAVVEEFDGRRDSCLMPPLLFVSLSELGHLLKQLVLIELEKL